jgi:hypothetical protein
MTACVVCLSFLSGSTVAIAGIADELVSSYSDNLDRDDAYAQLFRRIRGVDFENLTIAHAGAENAAPLLDWLDDNHKRLYRVLDTAYRTSVENMLADRAKEKAPTTTSPRVPIRRTTTRKISFDPSADIVPQTAVYSPDDEIKITRTETEDGFEMGAATENTKTVNGVVVTQGVAGNTRAIMADGGNTGTEYKAVEYIETDNRADRIKIRTETTVSWRTVVATCPDADGISAGTATMTNAMKMTITTPQTIGIMTRNITTTMRVKGYVDDAAELTHFETVGTGVETVSGYDRAARLDLIDDPEFVDGTNGVEYRITNGKPGKPVKDAYGFTRTVGRDLGDLAVKVPPGVSIADATRVDKNTGRQAGILSEQSLEALQTARGRWRYGACVDIKFTAPKTRLRPGETVDVTTETVHKWDKSGVNALLHLAAATQSATPEEQRGESSAIFSLSAPAKGAKASILVESTSRRGIALDDLHFEEEVPSKAPPPQPKKKSAQAKICNGWAGKITAVKTIRTEASKPASGRLVRSIENKEETFSVDYNVLGISDTSEGFANAFLADSQMNYRAVDYREMNYASGKMSCGNTIVTTGQTLKIESLVTAQPRKRITVFITSAGEVGRLTFGSPEINAERIITRTTESSCPSYNQTNSGVNRSDELIEVPSPGFEVEFELDADSERHLKGTKRIENSDGSVTVITWDLARKCA